MSDEKIYEFHDPEVIQLMQKLMWEKGLQANENEALDNIEFLVEIGTTAEKTTLSDYKFDFTSYLKDRRGCFARYLAQLAKEDDDQRAFDVVKALIAAGDIQKEMSISAIKEVLNNNVLNAVFDGNKKEEKKEEKPKVSEQKELYDMGTINASIDEINKEMEKQGIKPRIANDWSVSVTLSDATDQYQRHAFTMPSGNAYNVSMHDGANALEAMRLVFEFEKFVKLIQDAGAKFGKGYRQVPQQQYGDVERNYAPAPSEKPAQPKGNHAQQESPAQGALTREVVAIEIVQAKTEKKTIGYKPFYMSENNGKQERKQVASTGLWSTKANNALLKILNEQGVDLTPFKVGMVIPLDTPIICEYVQKPHFSNPEQKVNEVVSYRKAGQ